MTANGYAQTAIESFPPLLVELVRAEAPRSMLLEEGFKDREAGAVRALLSLSDHQPLDAGLRSDAGSSATATASSPVTR